jgi:hypothetical protein
MTRSFHVISTLIGVLALSGVALAAPETETNKTIAFFAVNGSTAGVGVNSPSGSSDCALGVINFNPMTTLGRLFYATLLDARSKGASVTLTYDQNGLICTLTQVSR